MDIIPQHVYNEKIESVVLKYYDGRANFEVGEMFNENMTEIKFDSEDLKEITKLIKELRVEKHVPFGIMRLGTYKMEINNDFVIWIDDGEPGYGEIEESGDWFKVSEELKDKIKEIRDKNPPKDIKQQIRDKYKKSNI